MDKEKYSIDLSHERFDELFNDKARAKRMEERNIKKDKMESRRIVRIRLAFLIILAISAFIYFYDAYIYDKEANRLEEYKQAAKAEEPTPAPPVEVPAVEEEPTAEEPAVEEPPYVSPIDFEYWKSINPDVIGYIYVPGTKIEYPILYDPLDNERYLHESIDGKQTVHGSIYLDSIANPDFTSKNNMIYGHNMRDGSMFKDVVKYKDFEYLKEHNEVYLYLPDREIKLRAIAAYYGKPEGSSRQVRFVNDEAFKEFVDVRLAHAGQVDELPLGDSANITQLFCLLTCSYEFNNARTFLYCVNESDYTRVMENAAE